MMKGQLIYDEASRNDGQEPDFDNSDVFEQPPLIGAEKWLLDEKNQRYYAVERRAELSHTCKACGAQFRNRAGVRRHWNTKCQIPASVLEALELRPPRGFEPVAIPKNTILAHGLLLDQTASHLMLCCPPTLDNVHGDLSRLMEAFPSLASKFPMTPARAKW